jgi:hypothetical protein
MDKPKTTPKDFFMWVGAMITLYGSVFAFLALMFDYLNYAFPDPLTYYPPDPYQGGISYEMSSLIILGAVCLILFRFIHRSIGQDPTRAEVWVRRWALYLTLFLAAATIVGDLITLLDTFFRGDELTARFLLKVVLVLLVASAGFMHFLADLRGYWEKNTALSVRVSIGVGILGVLTIVAGFFIIGTPMQARQYLFDSQKVSNLSLIQNEIVNYYQRTGKLPTSLNVLNDPISGFSVPTDAQGGMYSYTPLGGSSFNLCASFNADSRGMNTTQSMPMMPGAYGANVSDNWQHGSGNTCFLRTIDSALYPAAPKTK